MLLRLSLIICVVCLLVGCLKNPVAQFDAIVEIKCPIKQASDKTSWQMVYYQILEPSDIAGKYYIGSTVLSDEEIKKRVGRLYRIRMVEEWRYMLYQSPPTRVSSSWSESTDFFRLAVEVNNSPTKY